MNYLTSSFLMPITEDGQLTHQAVLSAISQGSHINEADKKFCFKVSRSPAIYPLQLVELKGEALPSQSNPKVKDVTFAKDEILRLKVKLSAARSVNVFDPNGVKLLRSDGKPIRKDVVFNLSNGIDEALSTLLDCIGLKLVRVSFVSQLHKIKVAKTNHKFFIPHVSVEFDASVVEPHLAESGFIRGIGKHKSYGFGYLELEDRFV